MPLIKLNDACKTYDLGEVKVEALRDANLILKRGEYVALMGPVLHERTRDVFLGAEDGGDRKRSANSRFRRVSPRTTNGAVVDDAVCRSSRKTGPRACWSTGSSAYETP